MHIRPYSLLAAGTLGALLAGAVQAQEEEPFDRSPRECISTTRLDSTTIIDDQTILFHMRNRQVYRNALPRRCPGLERAGRFTYEVRTSQLCEIDTITVLDQFGVGLSRGFTCRLGEFYPITEAEAEELELDPDAAQAGRNAIDVEEVDLEDEDEDEDAESGDTGSGGDAESESDERAGDAP